MKGGYEVAKTIINYKLAIIKLHIYVQVSKVHIRQRVYEVTCFLLVLNSEKLATGKEHTESESILLGNQKLIRTIKGRTVPHCC